MSNLDSYQKQARFNQLAAVAAMMCLLTFAGSSTAINAEPQEPKFEMGTFYVCLVVKPANFKRTPEIQPIAQAHFKHVQDLLASGKAAVAGPFTDDTRIAGIFVINASSPEEARAIEEQDPLVKSAGFTVE